MRLLAFTSALVLTLACSSVWAQSQQQNFERGEDAYQRKDYATALAIWLPLAEQRHSLAQYNIAYMYKKGLGTAANDAAACTWFSQAAAQNDLAAIVATCLLAGLLPAWRASRLALADGLTPRL